MCKQQSEVLKLDFTQLLNTVSLLKADVFISGPVPLVERGEKSFSRFLALKKWLSSAYTVHSLHFIDLIDNSRREEALLRTVTNDRAQS